MVQQSGGGHCSTLELDDGPATQPSPLTRPMETRRRLGAPLAAADEWRRHMAWAGVGVELVLLLISHQASYDSVVSWVSWVS